MFDPTGSLSIAEAVTVSVNVAAIYAGEQFTHHGLLGNCYDIALEDGTFCYVTIVESSAYYYVVLELSGYTTSDSVYEQLQDAVFSIDPAL